jgi:hypothetical protein
MHMYINRKRYTIVCIKKASVSASQMLFYADIHISDSPNHPAIAKGFNILFIVLFLFMVLICRLSKTYVVEDLHADCVGDPHKKIYATFSSKHFKPPHETLEERWLRHH